MTKTKSNQSHGIKTKRWTKFVSTLSHLSDGEIIIYLSKKLFILEENPNSISLDESHNIKVNKKKGI
jgi:hypothetical protein